jgi:hypothetical protein
MMDGRSVKDASRSVADYLRATLQIVKFYYRHDVRNTIKIQATAHGLNSILNSF